MTPKAKAAGTDIRTASNTTDPGNSTVSPSCQVGVVADWLQLIVQKSEARIDSRVLSAVAMGVCESIERGLAAGLDRHEIYRLARSAANGCRLALAGGCTDGNIT